MFMAYLVTGGAGCVGAYIMRDLLKQGEKVINFDLDMRQGIMEQVITPEAISGVEMVQGDITDFAHLCRTIKTHGVKTVIHLASLQIPASNANPALAMKIVSGGLVNVLEAARILDLNKIVWSSSIAVYGPASEYGNQKVRNDAHHRPQSVYGACKSLGEFLLSYYHKQYGVNGIGLRYTAIYGIGRERGLSSFTTEMIRKTAGGESYEVPFADDLIDWQYVEDVSQLTLRAAEVERTESRVFNTRGDVRPVKEGIEYLKKLEPGARLTPLQGKFGIAWEYDTTPLEEELGFRPQYTMEAGILKTFNIYRERAGRPPVSL
jgi:nucleoside-diphosphate-sugar epimerase